VRPSCSVPFQLFCGYVSSFCGFFFLPGADPLTRHSLSFSDQHCRPVDH
jgi:hypothetical protein